MNEKVQEILSKVDVVTEKCNIVPKFMDYSIVFMKKPVIACIPALLNKIISRFSLVTVALFTVLYIIYCLKNMVISFFFDEGPAGMCFGMVIYAIFAFALCSYVIDKTMGIFDNVIANSSCRISSFNIFSIMTVFFQFLALGSLVGGIYGAIEAGYFMLVIYGIVGALFFFLLSVYNSSPEEFAIVLDKDASAGEDCVAIFTFMIKVVLRLVPIAIFVLLVVGIVDCIPAIFTTYTHSFGNSISLEAEVMVGEMTSVGAYLLVGLLPVFAYIYYLLSYLSLDLVRAVLSLPKKLDNIQK